MTSTLHTPHGTLTIRPLRVGDAAALRDLRLEALRSHPEAFGMDYGQNLGLPIETWEERVQRGMGNDLSITYVADAGDMFVGMAGIFRSESVKMWHAGTIFAMYVRPAWRGSGLAAALIESCAGWAQAHAMRLLKLSVVTTNIAAIRCYARQGFTVYGIDPDVIQAGGVYYDMLLMARRLEAPHAG